MHFGESTIFPGFSSPIIEESTRRRLGEEREEFRRRKL